MYGEEFYEFEQMIGDIGGELLLAVAGIIGVVALVIALVIVVGYVFQSIGLYTIAKRRGIKNPWLAWLPVGNYWIAGSIADQYQYVTSGTVKNKRIVLLALSIAGVAFSSFIASDIAGGFVLTFGQVSADQLASLGVAGAMLNLVRSGLEIATFIFWQMALYDLYTSCNPKNNVLFLVLGIIFGITVPYFIFACRNKEVGMPPRREEPQYQHQPTPEPRTYQDPWEN